MTPLSHSLDFVTGRLTAFFQFVVEFKRFHSYMKFTFGYFGQCDVANLKLENHAGNFFFRFR